MVKKRIIRILVKNSNKFIYIYLINVEKNYIITSISTKNIKNKKSKNNIQSAKIIGVNALKYLRKIKFSQVEFDIYNKKYHGKIKIIFEIIKNKYKLL